MIAWRLCRRPYAVLDGEGARRFGGRWNSPGRPLVYLADHPALAALEVRVHLDLPFDLLPSDYVLMQVDIPDPESIEPAATTVKAATLGWPRCRRPPYGSRPFWSRTPGTCY